MTAEILTFGCRLNIFESEVIRGHTAHLSDTVVINTCAVTAEAERQARKTIRRLHRERPTAQIIITGCAAQIAPDSWSTLPGVTRILGNTEKLQAQAWTEKTPRSVSDIMSPPTTPPPTVRGYAGHARAFVQIQQGCDHRCTFCIIPFGRGPSRSTPIAAIATQIQSLVDAGYNEAILTGVDITSYGADLPGHPTLGQMIRQLLARVPDLPRLRLSSLDPACIDNDLWHLIATEPRLMPHLHLSLQSASDMILKRMKRRHTAAQAAALITRARHLRPNIAIGADLIAGFPTESDAHFTETLDFIEQHEIPYLHVFPYSERQNTPAARMPAVPLDVRRDRAARLRTLAAGFATQLHNAQIGHERRVLTEANQAGHTDAFAPVRMTEPHPPGQIINARIVAADAKHLLAEAA